MALSIVDVVREVGGAEITYTFRRGVADKATELLDKAISESKTDAEIRKELGKYMTGTDNPDNVRKKTAAAAAAAAKAAKVETKKPAPKAEPKKAKAASAPKSTSESKRARGENNDKRKKALTLMAKMHSAGSDSTAILIAVQKELDISYANAYYYWGRVFMKSLKASPSVKKAKATKSAAKPDGGDATSDDNTASAS